MNLNLSTQAEFGVGKINLLCEEMSDDALVICSPSVVDLLKDKCAPSKEIALELQRGEPTVSSVNAILSRLPNSTRLVIGVGGGSAMDSAKAVAACLEAGVSDCSQLLDQVITTSRSKVRLVLAPSTSGTGSELSMGSIIYDPSQKLKRGIRGKGVLADKAIVDPVLTYSCNAEVTAQTGFDCFAHSIETFVSKKSSEGTQPISVENIKAVLEWLPIAVKDGANATAREKLSFASMMAGRNLSAASTCLPHRIQYAFADDWRVSHGLGLAMIYPSWIKSTYTLHERFKLLEKYLGGVSLLDEVNRLLKETGIEQTIKIKVSEIQFSIRSDMVKGNLTDDPGYSNESLGNILDRMRNDYERRR